MKSLSFILALLVFAVGCSESKSNQPAGRTAAAVVTPAGASVPSGTVSNPCKLVSQAEVSAAMGKKSNPGEFHPTVGGRCNFYDSSSQYEIFLQNTPPYVLDGIAHIGNNSVSGIGDRAFWSDGSLYVQKGNQALQIGFFLPHPMKTMTPEAEKLCSLIVSRM